jgi:hypothetical protein
VYRETVKQLQIDDFVLPFGGKLRDDNRWVIYASLIPWDFVDEVYSKVLSPKMGAQAYNSRIAFGAIFIRDTLNISDEETPAQIRENPYLQFLLGYLQYRDVQPFDPSLMVTFRKRFGPEGIKKINERIAVEQIKKARGDSNNPPHDPGSSSPEPPASAPLTNKGALIADATCGPADIRFPTDVSLLNEARENGERLIDHLCTMTGSEKPRMYRNNARKDFLSFIKNKKPRPNKVRRAIKSQLQYIKRDLGYIDALLKLPCAGIQEQLIGISKPANDCLEKKWEKRLGTLRKVYAQQLQRYETGSTPGHDRIVSFSQPHVRAIVRGKAGVLVEFGNKFSLMVVDGFCLPCELSWNAYNEGTVLKDQIEYYRQLFGYYPESVHVDKIYGSQSNRRYCEARRIRLSCKPLGRPPKETETNRRALRQKAKQRRQDEVTRIQVEGKFGNSKRAGELGCIRTKLEDTSEVTINLVFLIMNLRKLLRQQLIFVFSWIFGAFKSSMQFLTGLVCGVMGDEMPAIGVGMTGLCG